MRAAHFTTRFAFACLFPLAACSAAPGGDEAASSDLTINPSGGDAAGKLLVVAPKAIGGVWKILAQRVVSGGTGTTLELTANVSQVVPAGNYCFWTQVAGIDTLPHCEAVNPGAATVNVLGAVKFTRSTPDLVYGVDWPADSKLSQLVGQPDVPHVSGTVTLGAGPLSTTFQVAPDALTTIDVTGTDKPALRVIGSQQHELPNAVLGMDAASCPQPVPGGPRPAPCKIGDFDYALRVLQVLGATSNVLSSGRIEDAVAGGRSLLLRADASTTLTLQYRKCMNGVDEAQKASCYSMPNVDVDTSVALNAPPTVLRLGRLEVNKIAFTKLDGTVVMVDGEFDVKVDFATLFTAIPLGTGMDVLPSSLLKNPYTVVIRYKNPNDGAPITSTQEVVVEP